VVEKQIQSLKNNPDNFDQHLAPDVAEAVNWLKTSADALGPKHKKAKQFLAEAEARIKNPANYVRGKLNPSAAATMANLTRKKKSLEQELTET
jgi:hypothetical protein